MFKALATAGNQLDKAAIIASYREYMQFVVDALPDQSVFLQNMEAKLEDSEFLGDTAALLRPTEVYDPVAAYEVVRSQLIDLI